MVVATTDMRRMNRAKLRCGLQAIRRAKKGIRGKGLDKAACLFKISRPRPIYWLILRWDAIVISFVAAPALGR
jgi:hypothetical protein